MGRPKATVAFGGASLGALVATAMREVARPVVAVGPAFDTGLESVDDPREGPLVALLAGADALRARGSDGPVLMAACDLPFVSADALSFVADSLDDRDAAVPVVDGRDQPSMSCFSPRSIELARDLVADGIRSFREWIEHLDVRRLAEADWSERFGAHVFRDVDTPDDLERARALLIESRARIAR